MSDYQPIDCGRYNEYELIILRRQRLRLVWRDPTGIIRVGVVQPIDLRTREHAEYLLAIQGEEHLTIRLDYIIRSDIYTSLPLPQRA